MKRSIEQFELNELMNDTPEMRTLKNMLASSHIFFGRRSKKNTHTHFLSRALFSLSDTKGLYEKLYNIHMIDFGSQKKLRFCYIPSLLKNILLSNTFLQS